MVFLKVAHSYFTFLGLLKRVLRYTRRSFKIRSQNVCKTRKLEKKTRKLEKKQANKLINSLFVGAIVFHVAFRIKQELFMGAQKRFISDALRRYIGFWVPEERTNTNNDVHYSGDSCVFQQLIVNPAARQN